MTEKIVDEILKFVQIVRPTIKITIIKEKVDDNRILECAIAAKADYLVSGDKKHILPLKRIDNIKIVSAKEFIQNL